MRLRGVENPAVERAARQHDAAGYRGTLGKLPSGVTVATAVRGSLPFIHLFATDRALLEAKLPALLRALEPDGTLWVS